VSPAQRERTAVWALTPKGAGLARCIAAAIPGSTILLSEKQVAVNEGAIAFNRLKDALDTHFSRYPKHVFIMAAGIVVRLLAGRLAHKTTDPAVVVCDEAGSFAISLLSGHVGGANTLAREVARITGGQPVITTATDVNQVPAIDLIAVHNHLRIENPEAVKTVNMALLTGRPIALHDPYERVARHLPEDQIKPSDTAALDRCDAGVFVDHMRLDLPPQVLVLRPGSLVAGMGCNRGTDMQEMRDLLEKTLAANGLAISSLRALATVDLKADEPGLLALAASLEIPLATFSRERLSGISHVPTPSAMVEKHIGVKSVCEAAALLATHRGRLIVPKQKTANVTVAVAADGYTSSASVPAHRST
jgi:cobalt-precorrin 5A hydrolase